MKSARFTLAFLSLTALASVAPAATELRRFAVVVGANAGVGRPALRYAVADATRFADVLKELGGVQSKDMTVLSQPTSASLETAIRSLKVEVERARSEARRVEVVFYYSGHADESGLLLGADAYSYQDLREQLNSVNADVQIAVLDACASGAMTRLKGGASRRPFLVDASSNMRGHAFLTSSSADESAQESDRIGGSFFTHFLVSGLRGAADSSGEGKVTLNEAYQYAFNETLGRTLKTQGGPQHPSYDIGLSGTGDVVITDLRETTSSLVLDADVVGRCYVREQKAGIVIEVEKPLGRRVELGVGPGRYEVHCQEGGSARSSRFGTEGHSAHILSERDFEKAKLDPTLRRGGANEPATRLGMDGAHRVGFEGGGVRYHYAYKTPHFFGPGAEPFLSGESQSGFEGEITLSHWVSPRLGLEARLHSHRTNRRGYDWSDTTFVTGVLVGARFELNRSTRTSATRPFLHASIGPFHRPPSKFPLEPGAAAETSGQTTLGTSVGGGLDFRFGSHLGLGARSSYDLMPEFKDNAGVRYNYNGWRHTMTASWFFGNNRKAKSP